MSNVVIIAKVLGINTSDGVLNLLVDTENHEKMNIKVDSEYEGVIQINQIYQFNLIVKEGTERTQYIMESFKDINSYELEDLDEVLRKFQSTSKMSLVDSECTINSYVERIDNKIIHEITANIVARYRKDFYTYPAGVKYHHAYVGGLAYHTIGMLQLADGFIVNYPYLSKDYLFAGIILHDMGKVLEFSGAQSTEYALRGQMLGHLVLGSMIVDEEAKKLGYDTAEEVLLLEHMLVSHHGQPQFGAAKKPMTAEALLLWYIDMLDSKFRVLGEELDKTEPGKYTENIGVLDKMKFYKPFSIE